jgi:hypothetical protein
MNIIILSGVHYQELEYATHIVVVQTSLSGFDLTISHVHRREYNLHTLKLQYL